ncbi:MAG: MbnH family di-heme enzyme [Acidobacteriota bacterium]
MKIKNIKIIALLIIITLAIFAALIKFETNVAAHDGKAHAPAAAKKLQNPLNLTEADLINGRALYNQHCASCHGADGKAQTAAAKALKKKPTDLTDHHTHFLKDGEIYWVIANGIRTSGMPAYKTKMSERERWQVVSYVRQFYPYKDDEPQNPKTSATSSSQTQDLAINFRAMVGDQNFTCSSSYEGIGTTGSTITVSDFRLYVHNLRLIDSRGNEVPLQLAQDGKWQYDNVALLDFENGEGNCANGTKEINDTIRGKAPVGNYVGLRFIVGLPFDKNHNDPTTQPSPLNLSRMFWNWNAGYKFARIDMKTTGQPKGFVLHLGSTSCMPNTSPNTVPTACANGNRPEITLKNFNPQGDVVIADLKALLKDTNVDVNQPNTAVGCMSASQDADCAGIFKNLGLPFAGVAATGQSFFHLEKSTKTASATTEGEVMKARAAAYEWNLPKGFPTPRVPEDNPMTAEKVELGRYLFYDKQLSITGKFACASCHKQERAFADENPLAVGATGEHHPRNSMGLTNIAYSPVLTWSNPNMRQLEKQALVPMFGEHPIELGLSGKDVEVLQRLKGEPIYQKLFAAAFPEDRDPFTLGNLTKALASFERTLISGNSPYDRYRYSGDKNAISASAKRGENLFFSERLECFHCHGGFNFTETVDHVGKAFAEIEFHNTGLYNIDSKGAYPATNTGIFDFSKNAEDMGKFKAPTLRNIALTAPFMHDGSIQTLEEAIDHYAAGGRTIKSGEYAGVGRDNPFKSSFVKGFKLTAQEKTDLVNFLKSLTDELFITDARLSDPWKKD